MIVSLKSNGKELSYGGCSNVSLLTFVILLIDKITKK